MMVFIVCVNETVQLNFFCGNLVKLIIWLSLLLWLLAVSVL